MRFKIWLENLVQQSEKAFTAKKKIQKSDIASELGFNQPLQKYAEGSFSTLYQHPTQQNVLIKVTSHESDARRAWKAQSLESLSIVHLLDKPIQKIINGVKCWILLVEKVTGKSIHYSNVDILRLYDLFKKYENYIFDYPESLKILKLYNSNNEEEHEKLITLFETMKKLEEINIHLVDLTDNIIDNGQRYVIIDLGF